MRFIRTSLRAKGWKAIFTKSNGQRYLYQRQDSRRQAIHSWGYLSGCNRRSNVQFVLATQKQRPGSSCPYLNSGCYMPGKTVQLRCPWAQQNVAAYGGAALVLRTNLERQGLDFSLFEIPEFAFERQCLRRLPFPDVECL
jgi:hypothetical protein